MRFLRPFFVIYGTGIVGTFAWLFFAFSGTSACAASRNSCETAMSMAGQLALVWPAYLGGMFAEQPIMIPTLPFKIVLTSLLVLVTILVFARAHALSERHALEAATSDPLFDTNEPNRHDQSTSSPETPEGSLEPVTRIRTESTSQAPLLRDVSRPPTIAPSVDAPPSHHPVPARHPSPGRRGRRRLGARRRSH